MDDVVTTKNAVIEETTINETLWANKTKKATKKVHDTNLMMM